MGKPLDSPASFRPISLTSWYQSFLNALCYLVYSSFSSPIPFSPPGRFPPWTFYSRSSFSVHFGWFNKPRPGSWTILATNDFSKAFNSVWHPALFHKLILAGLPPCFARWTRSFYSDRRTCVVYQNHKSRFFRVRRGVPQGSVLGPVLFSLHQ